MALEILPLGNIVNIGELTRVALSLNSHATRTETKDLLHSRHLLGVLRRHGGRVSHSELAVSAARRLHISGKLGVYALRDNSRYVGMATVDPTPVLRKQALSMPPKYAWGPLSKDLSPDGPEVTAWVYPGHGPSGLHNLTAAYRSLKDADGIARKHYQKFAEQQADDAIPIKAWTIEPLDAPTWIHTAIKQAGFCAEQSSPGYYDDGESKQSLPPVSRLYIARSPEA